MSTKSAAVADDRMKKRVVITGVTRGLGCAMAARFVERGWLVAGCGRSAESIESLRVQHGDEHRFDVVDVTDAETVLRWGAAVIESHDAPDLLVNNAAVMNELRPLWEVPVEEFELSMRVNLQGIFHVLRAFTPAMNQRRQGVIVNFSSGWGRSTAAEVAPYCATKWGVEGLTQAFAQELPRGVAAVALNPGIIDTDMLRICFGEEAGRYPNAERWSEVAVPFLMSLTAQDNGRSVSVPGM